MYVIIDSFSVCGRKVLVALEGKLASIARVLLWISALLLGTAFAGDESPNQPTHRSQIYGLIRLHAYVPDRLPKAIVDLVRRESTPPSPRASEVAANVQRYTSSLLKSDIRQSVATDSPLVDFSESQPSTIVPQELQLSLENLAAQSRGIFAEEIVVEGLWYRLAKTLEWVGHRQDSARIYRHIFKLQQRASIIPGANDFSRLLLLNDHAFLLGTLGELDAMADLADEGRRQCHVSLERLPDSPLSDTPKAIYKNFQNGFVSLLARNAALRGDWLLAEQRHRAAANLYPAGTVGNFLEMQKALSAMLKHLERPNDTETVARSLLAEAKRLWPLDDYRQGFVKIYLAHALVNNSKPSEAERVIAEWLSASPPGKSVDYDGSRKAEILKSHAEYVLLKAYRLQGKRTESVALANRMLQPNGITLYDVRPLALDYPDYLEEILLSVAPSAKGGRYSVSNEIFSLVQKVQASRVSGAVRNLVDRYTKDGEEIDPLVREHQDLQRQLDEYHKHFAAGLVRSSDDHGELPIVAVERRFAAISRELKTKNPNYLYSLTDAPITIEEAQTRLATDEAMVNWFIGDKGAWAIVVTAKHAQIIPLATTRKEVRKRASLLRQSLTPIAANGRASLSAFPTSSPYELFRLLFEPIWQSIAASKHLYLIPDRTFSDIPVSVLPIEQPAVPLVNPDDARGFGRIPWLAKHKASTILPSISSIYLIQQTRQSRSGPTSFLGIGDPKLNGAMGAGSRGWAGNLLAHIPTSAGVANVQRVAALTPLPETADELREMGKMFSSDANSLILGRNATEPVVKKTKFDRYGVIAFSTHAVIAGELEGLREPGLILTPPATATHDDDGVLTASEIARLKLNAEWVVLSACNTASKDSGGADEIYGGLARSFFYAGTRSLLVSHWAVLSVPTVSLTTETIRHSARGQLRKAEAHRLAMLSMINSGDPMKAHPSSWGGFVVIGDSSPVNESMH